MNRTDTSTATKLEVCSDGATRTRYRPRAGQGGPSIATATRQTLTLAAREFEHGRRELLEAVDALASVRSDSASGRAAQASRRDALGRIRLASSLLADLARGGQEDASGEEPASLDLTPFAAETVATEATAGRMIYCALERNGRLALIANLRSRLHARGLELVDDGPGWFIVSAPQLPQIASCQVVGCGGRLAFKRCQRCGTRR